MCYKYAQRDGFHFVVDVDIKGFFDNVNHAKLLKQIWTLGIQDKNLLCLIGKMLKAPIEDKGERFVPIKEHHKAECLVHYWLILFLMN